MFGSVQGLNFVVPVKNVMFGVQDLTFGVWCVDGFRV